MKMNIDKAIEILQEYVELDREVREGDTESDYSRFCEEKVEAIESLIEYTYANKCAFKTSNVISKKDNEIKTINTNKLTETDLKKILVCLENGIYKTDEYITEEQRKQIINYNYDIIPKLYNILGMEDSEDKVVDIDNLEII